MSEKLPKISIIIPVYNVEEYLSKCLESVVNQTLIDIEIICVNDGTRDDSLEILEEYRKCDDRIIIINKGNGGLSSARNAGLAVAKGKYICFLDSDDYFELNACERLYGETLENTADIIVFGANVFPAFQEIDWWTVHNLSPRTIQYKKFNSKVLFKENGAYPFVWRNCIKREFLLKQQLFFDETVKYGEDLIFQFCAFPQASSINFISDKLYNYRWCREGSLMDLASKRVDKKCQAHIFEIVAVLKYWQRHGILDRYGKEFWNWSLEFICDDFRKIDKAGQIKLARDLIRIWKKYGLFDYSERLLGKQKDFFDYIIGMFCPRIKWRRLLLLPFRLIRCMVNSVISSVG